MKCLIAVVVVAALAVEAAADQSLAWPQFRGPGGSGIAEDQKPPVELGPDKNVKWKVPVTGLGHSSPIVWGNQVCTASAISGTPDPQLKVGLYGDIGSVLDTTAHKWVVACFDKNTGKPRWERIAKTGVPVIKRHPKSTHASSTGCCSTCPW